LTVDAFRRQDVQVAAASRALATLLREIGEAEATCILLDASASGSACFELFGRMRDVLWQQDHEWVLAIEDTDRATAMKPPADAFFDSLISLEPWPVDKLAEVLAHRGDPGEQWPAELLLSAAAGAQGSPREAVRALSDAAVHGYDPAETLEARRRLVDLASAQGRPAGMLAELLERGQASPSDEDLQRTLGVSRARLNQVFRQLLERRLVRAETERADGPGAAAHCLPTGPTAMSVRLIEPIATRGVFRPRQKFTQLAADHRERRPRSAVSRVIQCAGG
jgi:hypothetical protein